LESTQVWEGILFSVPVSTMETNTWSTMGWGGVSKWKRERFGNF